VLLIAVSRVPGRFVGPAPRPPEPVLLLV
jgi:hypothetical protein